MGLEGGGEPSGGDAPSGGGDPPDLGPGGGGGEMPTDDGSGGGDEGPHIGGRLGWSVLGGVSSVMLGDEGGEGDEDGDEGEGFPELHDGLVRDIGRGGPPIDPEGGGWGQDEGDRAEGPPTFHVSGSASLFTALGRRGHTPTEDWGDSNDPRVLVAFAASVLRQGASAAVERALGTIGI